MTFKELFPKQYDRVVAWNNTARTYPPSYAQQKVITLSEVNELLSAETTALKLDGYADVFVTASYLESIDNYSGVVEKCLNLVKQGFEEYSKEVIKECIDEVLDSNDTKFWNISGSDAGTIVGESVRLKEETGLDITIRTTKDKIVFLDSNNKVRKATGYRDPDLDKIIIKYGLEV